MKVVPFTYLDLIFNGLSRLNGINVIIRPGAAGLKKEEGILKTFHFSVDIRIEALYPIAFSVMASFLTKEEPKIIKPYFTLMYMKTLKEKVIKVYGQKDFEEVVKKIDPCDIEKLTEYSTDEILRERNYPIEGKPKYF